MQIEPLDLLPRAAVEAEVLRMAAGREAEVEARVRAAGTDGRLDRLIPGFSRLQGCSQPPNWHSEGDALVHTAKVFAVLAGISVDLPARERFVLLVAALVHDIEKPATRKDTAGHISFHGHAEAAAARCPEFARAFHLTPDEAERLQFLVAEHMTAHRMHQQGEGKRLEIYSSPHFSALLLFQEADARGSWLDSSGTRHAEVLRDKLIVDRDELVAAEASKGLRKRLTAEMNLKLRGRGIQAGPYYGGAGKELQAKVCNGDILTSGQMESWLERYLSAHPPP